jgi:peptidoglycan hydrolase CwlO-like protein
MNITNPLLRRSKTNVAEGPSATTSVSTSNFIPPSSNPPGASDNAPWPMRAKVLVGVLLVAAVLATVGAAVGLTSGDDGSAERQLQDQIATLTAERGEALADVATLDAELADVRGQLQAAQADVATLDAELADLLEQLQAAQAGNDDLTDRADALEVQIAELMEQKAAVEGQVDELGADLATVKQQLTDAIAERDALAKVFPKKFDSVLGNSATAGTYDVTLSEVYCSALTSCGKAPSLPDLTITATSDGQLRFKIPNFAEGGLFRADGVFHTVLDTTTAVPACDGVARAARVVMTITPGSYEVGTDRVPDVVSLSAVITVEAAAVGSCPAGLAFYSAELAPHA